MKNNNRKQKNKTILSVVLSVFMLFSMLPLHAFADETPANTKKIYMFGEVIPNEKNVGVSTTTSYEAMHGFLPKTVNTYVYNGEGAEIEVLPVTWSVKTHTTKGGAPVDIASPTFTVGDVIVFEAACKVYPYMNEEATTKPIFTITLTGEGISLIKQFSLDETDLDRQDAIIPTAEGVLTMPTSVAFRADGQLVGEATDRSIKNLNNASWKLKEAPSGHTIVANETAADFTSYYPKGTYIYEFVIDENVEYCVKLKYDLEKEEWIPIAFSKFAFAPDATNTNLPIREVIWTGTGGAVPTYTVTKFETLEADVATQIFAKGDTFLEVRKPSKLKATATNSVTGNIETIEIPVSWSSFSTSEVGEHTMEATPNSSGSKVNGYVVNLNGKSLPTITVKVKNIAFSPLTTLPHKEYFIKQPLGDVHDFTPEIPMSVNFEQENSKPYTDAVASLELKSITNSAGGIISLNSNKYLETADTYTFTYFVSGITVERMIWKEVWEGYQAIKTNFTDTTTTITQTITITDAPYEEHEFIRFVDSKYNADGDYEHITIEKDGVISFDPPSSINVVVYDSIEGTNGYEKTISKPVKWVNATGTAYDKNTFNTGTPGTYTFTAKFDTSPPSARSMAPVLSSIPTPVVKMPSFSITVYDFATDTIKPKYGDGSPTNPFIYYLGLGETKALLDKAGNKVLFERIYKADANDVVYRDGKTNISTITNVNGKIVGVTGISVGSDPLVIEDNFPKEITKHAWVYVIDAPHKTKHPAETDDWYMPGSTTLPEHMIDVDKSAAWTADGADTAKISFIVEGIEVAIPRSADIIFVFDASGSMVNAHHWDKAKMALSGISDVAFGVDGENPYNNRLSLALFGNDSTGSFNFVSDKTMYEQKIANLETPSGSARTGYTSGLAQATAYAESRTGNEVYRPLYVFFFSDGDHEQYYAGNDYYTSNYEKIDDRNINELKTRLKSVNQAITIHKPNDFLNKFNNTDHGVDVNQAGLSLDKYYKYMHQITTSAENLVITDVIEDEYKVIEAELPANMTLTTNSAGKEEVTITIGRVNVGDIITVNIPIKIKDQHKPTGGDVVTYPTNESAKAVYENFQFKEKEITDDATKTPAPYTIQKPKLSYPSTGVIPPPPSGVTHTVTYTDGVDGEVVFADQVIHGIVDGDKTPDFNLGGSNIPTRPGYTFTGWSPTVAETVTESIIYTAHWSTPYTVTYTDGVDGEVVFADQVHPNLNHGVPTPAFLLNGSNIPTRAGYIFAGWLPNVSDKVIKNVVYIAQWNKDVPREIPKTGDSSNVMMWMMVALSSGLGLLFFSKKSLSYKEKPVSKDNE